VHGGVRVREEVALGVEHRERLLTGGRGVEIGEGVAVDLLGQDREVRLDRGGVEGRTGAAEAGTRSRKSPL
jgi:hypothetical protein